MLERTAASRRMPTRRERLNRFLTMQAPLIGGFVLLIAVGLGVVVLLVDNHRFNQSVAHTLQVRNDAYRLLTLVQDAETGERGYLLTGNPVYLKPYDMGRLETPKALAELQQLLARNEIQMATLARLRTSVQAKLDDLHLTVGLKEQGQADAALKHVNTNVGNDIMQQIRTAVGQIEDEEERMQRAQSVAADANNRQLAIASIVGLLVVIALAAVSILTGRRSTAELLAAQTELRHANENLEGIVAERVAELQAANEEIQRFAYIVSHDLRAPLVNVMGFTSELDAVRGDIVAFLKEAEAKLPEIVTPERRMAIETDLPEALGFIRTSTAKMDRLINAILKLSREGRRVLTPQSIDLRELVEAQGESLSQQMQEADAELKVQPDLPDVVSDRLAVEQIFGNLIENAIKYLQPGRPGRIEVTGRVQGAYHHYAIVDNGRGIDKKDFERVFELFRRSGEQDKPGEGIGLAYVRNLVRRLGGNVTVKSELGVGSTFTVTLPAVLTLKARSK